MMRGEASGIEARMFIRYCRSREPSSYAADMRSKRRELDLLAAVLVDVVLKRVPQIFRECDDEGLVLHSSIPKRFSATSGLKP
jgi:hypothetical protein